MGRRMVTVAVAVLVTAALVVGGVLVASRRAQREPAALAGLQVAGDQAAATAEGGAIARAAPGRAPAPGRAAAGPVQYEVRGELPELDRSARAWTLDESATSATVSALAGKLGLSGPVRQEELSWTVGDSRRNLRATRVPGLPWSFHTGSAICSRPLSRGAASKEALSCATIAPEVAGVPPARPAPGVSSSVRSVPPARPAPGVSSSVRSVPPRPVQLPDQATAERIARELLTRLGVRLDGADVRLTRGFDRWFALASPLVGGMPTAGFSWSVGVGAKGEVVSASGWLATPRAGDTYPLITVREALDRLRQRRLPGPVDILPAQPLPSPVRPECRQMDVVGGCAPPRAPSRLAVTDVRLGLQLASALPRGGAGQRVNYLVPAYFFQLEGTWARQVPVIALPDRFLTAPSPTVMPQEVTPSTR